MSAMLKRFNEQWNKKVFDLFKLRVLKLESVSKSSMNGKIGVKHGKYSVKKNEIK